MRRDAGASRGSKRRQMSKQDLGVVVKWHGSGRRPPVKHPLPVRIRSTPLTHCASTSRPPEIGSAQKHAQNATVERLIRACEKRRATVARARAVLARSTMKKKIDVSQVNCDVALTTALRSTYDPNREIHKSPRQFRRAIKALRRRGIDVVDSDGANPLLDGKNANERAK